MKKAFLTVLCCLSGFVLIEITAQTDRIQIQSVFPYIAYSEDSIIRLAANYCHLHLEGIAIEFDSIGKPLSIGHYNHGKKEGEWLMSDGSSKYFKKGKESGSSAPGCGTGWFERQKAFDELYEELVFKKRTN